MEKKNALATQIEALRKLTTAELKGRYRKVFGEATKSNNKPYLLKRIACGAARQGRTYPAPPGPQEGWADAGAPARSAPAEGRHRPAP